MIDHRFAAFGRFGKAAKRPESGNELPHSKSAFTNGTRDPIYYAMNSPPHLLRWLDEQTGLVSALGDWLRRPVAGGPGWRLVWPTAFAFTFVVEAITGLVLWMYYSPGAQSSWESVYYLQYHVQDGWLLRAVHYYAAQAMLAIIGAYVLQMVLCGDCRPARTVLVWIVLLMGLVTLALNLTGDLLPWDQNSYWATSIRMSYVSHVPLVGPWIAKLALGGPQFGTLTLTRFLALHAGVFAAGCWH